MVTVQRTGLAPRRAADPCGGSPGAAGKARGDRRPRRPPPAAVGRRQLRGVPVVCTIFMAEPISADTSVMLLGTISVVVASLATWL